MTVNWTDRILSVTVLGIFRPFPFTFTQRAVSCEVPLFPGDGTSPAPRGLPFVPDGTKQAWKRTLNPLSTLELHFSSPGARAGWAGGHVSAGSTVGVHKPSVWVSDKHRFAKRVLAELAKLLF